MGETSIQWTDKSWNPTVGCTRCSPGCRECYAFALHDMRHAAYQSGKKIPAQYAKPFTELQLMEDRLEDPLRWRKPCRVFVNSVSDLFHKDVPDAFIDKVFAVMALAPQHTFQVLTKRAERMREYMNNPMRQGRVNDAAATSDFNRQMPVWFSVNGQPGNGRAWPLANCWLGVSVEDQQRADERIPHLLQTPAAVRFLSVEPLLGPVNLAGYLGACTDCSTLTLPISQRPDGFRCHWCCGTGRLASWVIVGGESGRDARHCRTEWIRSVAQQCKAANVPVFVKQLGANITTTLPAGEVWPGHDGPRSRVQFSGDGFGNYHVSGLRDSKGGEPAEWPADLRVREFPEVIQQQ